MGGFRGFARWNGGIVWRTLTVGFVLGIGTAAAQRPSGDVERPATQPADSQIFEAGDVHLGNSRVYVRVGKSGLGHEHGVSGRLQAGRIRWGAADGAGELVFDMNSFVADTEEARKYVGLSGTTDADTQRKVTENMRGVDVLNVRQYPTARFQIKSIQKLQQVSRRGLPLYQLQGDFTLQQATRPIQVVAEAEQKAGWLHVRGSFSIRQSEFGMTPYSRAFGAVGVADELQIWGDLWVAQQRMAVRASAGSVR